MAITFTRTNQTYSAAADTMTSSATEITANAIQVKGDPHIYKDLGLRLSIAPTLFVTPTTYGELPEPGDTVVWPLGGSTYTVQAVSPIAPDGVVIAARIVISK